MCRMTSAVLLVVCITSGVLLTRAGSPVVHKHAIWPRLGGAEWLLWQAGQLAGHLVAGVLQASHSNSRRGSIAAGYVHSCCSKVPQLPSGNSRLMSEESDVLGERSPPV